MQDIGIELLEQIQKDFGERYKNSEVVKSMLLKLKNGTATFEDAYKFSAEIGEMLSKSYTTFIRTESLPDGRMYWNIAKSILEPTLGKDFDIVSDYASRVQKLLNTKAGIGLNAVKAAINQNRIYGLMNKLANAENFDDVAWVLREPIVNFSQSVVDDVVKENVEFHHKSGLHPKLTRVVMGNCCEWCRQMAGTYDYPNVPADIYRRHRDCRCIVLYNPDDGRGIQNSHTKKWSK